MSAILRRGLGLWHPIRERFTRGLSAGDVPEPPAYVEAEAAEYTLLVRDARTLALLGELPEYAFASWTRRAVEVGDFEISIHRDVVDADLISMTRLIEVRRDGEFEFAGIIEDGWYDAIDATWEVGGPCLKGFLTHRGILPPESETYDSVSAIPAETAMTGYVERHLTDPEDSARNINGELDGITFDIEPSQGRGGNVTFNGRYVNLMTGCLQQLATAGNLLHDVVFKPLYGGYRYRVDAPTDATATTGDVPVVFGLDWENVAKLDVRQSIRNVTNAVYVLGQGVGDARAVRVVEDTDSIGDHFRRESFADSRNNATEAALDLDGEIVVSRSLAQVLQVTAQPLIVGPTRYRRDWDLGYDVTIAVSEIGIAVDRRIVEVRVQLDRRAGEVIRIQLGALERTQARIIGEALTRANRVQVE